MIPMLQA